MVVIDNVVASGATWEAAQKVLPQADLVTLADARRGKNTSAVKSTTEEMMNSRGPMTTADESPVAVFDDVGNSFVILTSENAPDKNGESAPIMIWLRPDNKGNYLASAYSRTENGERKYVNLINGGKLRYLDKNKAVNLKLRGEAKSSFVSFSGDGNVLTPEDLTS